MNCYKISECQLDDTVKDCLRIEHPDCDLCDIKKSDSKPGFVVTTL
jgi:hypothetical protein